MTERDMSNWQDPVGPSQPWPPQSGTPFSAQPSGTPQDAAWPLQPAVTWYSEAQSYGQPPQGFRPPYTKYGTTPRKSEFRVVVEATNRFIGQDVQFQSTLARFILAPLKPVVQKLHSKGGIALLLAGPFMEPLALITPGPLDEAAIAAGVVYVAKGILAERRKLREEMAQDF